MILLDSSSSEGSITTSLRQISDWTVLIFVLNLFFFQPTVGVGLLI